MAIQSMMIKKIKSKSTAGRNSESDSSDTETEVATKGDVAQYH